MGKLVVRQGKNAGFEYVIPAGKDRVTLGRRRGIDFTVQDPKASRDHAEIVIEGDRLKLRDLKSRNGTMLNGKKVELDETLEAGDRIRIGDVVIEIVDTGAMTATPSIPGYEIIERIGPGTMGSVFKAKQVSMDRIVALKVLNEKYSKNEAFVSRFLREAQGAAQISHPNIIHVHDANYTGKTYYISMEYVDGTTLQNMIRKMGKVSVGDTLSIILQAARALGFAHGKKIVHRDLRPGTIMVTKNREAKIADLGLVKSFDEKVGGSSKPTLAGTLHYMAPEQALGKGTNVQTDVFSLGATMYHMLTGNVPFQGDSVEKVLEAHTTSFLPAIQETEPDVPDSVAAMIERMMARNPINRHQNMAEVTEDIQKLSKDIKSPVKKVAEGESSVTGAIPAVVEKKRKLRARRRIIKKSADVGGLIAALMVAIVAVISGIYLLRKPPKPWKSRGQRDTSRYADDDRGPVDPTREVETTHTMDPDVGWGDADEGEAPAATKPKLTRTDEALDSVVGVAGGAPVADDEPTVAEPEPVAPEPAAVAPEPAAPATAAAGQTRAGKHLGYCRADTWEKGTLTMADGTSMKGLFQPSGAQVRFKEKPDGGEKNLSAANVKEVKFARPNNIDASMADFILKQGKNDQALKRYEKALKALPGHPYIRVRIDECKGDDEPAAAVAQTAPAAQPATQPAATDAPAATGGGKVAQYLGFCRADTWEKGTLKLKNGTTMKGVFKPSGGSVSFKENPDAAARNINTAEIDEVQFGRPNNIDASMGDFILKQGKKAEALKRYQKAIKAVPGHPYILVKIEQCKE